MSDNAPAKVIIVWPWHFDELVLKPMQIVTISSAGTPQFLSIPVSTIDYDNLF